MIRFGIIGAGNIARKFAQDITAVDNATLVAVASRSMEKAEQFRMEFNLDYAFGSYLDLVAFEGVDAIYVATPHNFHKEHTMLSLRHKKHVLCEKPLAVNARDAAEMFAEAQRQNRLLMEALWTRFLPATTYLKTILEQHNFGLLKSIDVSFGFDMGSRLSPTGRILNPQLAGGSLLDLGVYNVSMLLLVASESINELRVTPVFADTGVDLHLHITGKLDNPQATTFALECAVDQALSNEAVLQFEHGTIVVPNFWSTTKVVVNDVTFDFPHRVSGFEYEIEAFANSILNQELNNPTMPQEETMKIVRLMDEIREKIGLVYPFEA